jgi:hypothetical protein
MRIPKLSSLSSRKGRDCHFRKNWRTGTITTDTQVTFLNFGLTSIWVTEFHSPLTTTHKLCLLMRKVLGMELSWSVQPTCLYHHWGKSVFITVVSIILSFVFSSFLFLCSIIFSFLYFLILIQQVMISQICQRLYLPYSAGELYYRESFL